MSSELSANGEIHIKPRWSVSRRVQITVIVKKRLSGVFNGGGEGGFIK